MLTAITINRFRGIRQGSLENLGPINILVGRNGSGKSTVLEAIYFVRAPYGSDITELRKGPGGDLMTDRAWYGRDSSHLMGITLHRGTNEIPLKTIRRNQSWSWEGTPNLAPDQKAFLEGLRLLHSDRLLSSKEDKVLWDSLVGKRKDRPLIRTIKEVYQLEVENLTFSAHADTLKVLFSDREFALDVGDLGSGIQMAARIFMHALLTQNSALLIEEFDAFQHASALDPIAKGLLSIVSSQQVQLFLTTHSLETVRAFINADTAQGGGNLRIFQTQLDPGGSFKTGLLNSQQALQLIESGYDLRKG